MPPRLRKRWIRSQPFRPPPTRAKPIGGFAPRPLAGMGAKASSDRQGVSRQCPNNAERLPAGKRVACSSVGKPFWRLRRASAIEPGLFEIQGEFPLARCQDPPVTDRKMADRRDGALAQGLLRHGRARLHPVST
jgi:hypothetical protein